MFPIPSAFKQILCPNKRNNQRCLRTYCIFNHDETCLDLRSIDSTLKSNSNNQSDEISSNYFVDLKPEYLKEHYSVEYGSFPSYSSTNQTEDCISNDLDPVHRLSKSTMKQSSTITSANSLENFNFDKRMAVAIETKTPVIPKNQAITKQKSDSCIGIKSQRNESKKKEISRERKSFNLFDVKKDNQKQSLGIESKSQIDFASRKNLVINDKKNDEYIDFTMKKIRIAHQSTNQNLKPVDLKKLQKPSPFSKKALQQQLLERYEKSYLKVNNSFKQSDQSSDKFGSISTTKTSIHRTSTTIVPKYPSMYKDSKHSNQICDKKTTISSIESNEPNGLNDAKYKMIKSIMIESNEIKARLDDHSATILSMTQKTLHPIDSESNKIPRSLRIKYLNKIYQELVCVAKGSKFSSEELARGAISIEFELMKKSKEMLCLYKSFSTSKICSIRSLETTLKQSIAKSKTNDNISENNNIKILPKKAKKTYQNLSPKELFNILRKLTIPKNEISRYGFPSADPKQSDLAVWNHDAKDKLKIVPYNEENLITCDRCFKTYRNPQRPEDNTCVYHSGHAYNQRIAGNIERQYNCCMSGPDSIGCKTANVHVSYGKQFLETYKGYVSTVSNPKKEPVIYALDCEMCFTDRALKSVA
ncbi:hypothetical protein SSS_07217 [Sarcoptes scabiei]|nr:hypothetical protein SSS_07217 [Sarcoptes scabiei]